MLKVDDSSGIVEEDTGLVIPGHPITGVFKDLGGMFPEGHQVVEGIDIPKVASMNQAHEHITDERVVFDALLKLLDSVERRFTPFMDQGTGNR